jgi:hypothetical protein
MTASRYPPLKLARKYQLLSSKRRMTYNYMGSIACQQIETSHLGFVGTRSTGLPPAKLAFKDIPMRPAVAKRTNPLNEC